MHSSMSLSASLFVSHISCRVFTGHVMHCHYVA